MEPIRAPTVLLVEDEPSIRHLLRGLLEDEGGYRVLTASDASEALLRVAEQPVDLVILDIALPRVSGREFARRYRFDIGATAPILIYTALGDPNLPATLSAEIPNCRFLAKPADIDAFLAAVASALTSAES